MMRTLSRFEPCLNCGASLGIQRLGVELLRLGFKRVHVDVSCRSDTGGFALSIREVARLMERCPMPLSIHLWPPYYRVERLPCRAEDIVFVHLKKAPAPELELARRVAGVGQVGLVIDRGELIPGFESLFVSEEICNVMALVIPLGSRGMPPAAWAEMGINRLLKIGRSGDVRVTVDGGVNRCNIGGTCLSAVDSIVVGGLLFGKRPSFPGIVKNMQWLYRCS